MPNAGNNHVFLNLCKKLTKKLRNVAKTIKQSKIFEIKFLLRRRKLSKFSLFFAASGKLAR